MTVSYTHLYILRRKEEKMKRKLLSLLLALTMTVSLLTVGASAVEPTYDDIAGHWAEASIERWSGHGIIPVSYTHLGSRSGKQHASFFCFPNLYSGFESGTDEE